nr:hypothetical protein [Ilumatobacter sp.]
MNNRSRALPMSEEDLHALVGHRLPGGTRTIEHWENWLLTDCTGSDQLGDDLVHPVALFHVPIQGAGTSIAELFELCGARGAGSVGLDGYDWEYFQPLRENVEYRFDGGVVQVTSTPACTRVGSNAIGFACARGLARCRRPFTSALTRWLLVNLRDTQHRPVTALFRTRQPFAFGLRFPFDVD